jgi:hypothetical protein
MAAVNDALAAAIEIRFAPTRERADRVRAALKSFERSEREAIEMSVTRDIIRALGANAQAADDEAARARDESAKELRAAMKDLLPVPGVPVKRAASPDEIERAQHVLAELEAAEGATMPPARLLLLLRALAAETRAIMEPLSSTDRTCDELTDALGAILRLRKSAGITEFIVGLQLSAAGDWAELARTTREKLARFDAAPSKKPLALVAGKRR